MTAPHRLDNDVVVVGAGFAGLYQLHRLRTLGFSTVLLEADSGLGGVWHWNCYPGARVDSHVPVYEFSDEGLWKDWYWDERFPDWTALRRYFQYVDDKWDLSRDICFDTRLDTATWDEEASCWHLHTRNGLTLRTRSDRADSWYVGANIPGKPRELLNFPGGVPFYAESCRTCAADGYSGFELA